MRSTSVIPCHIASQSLKRNDGSVLSLNQTNSLDNAGRISQWDVSFGQASAGAAVTYGKFGSVEKEVFNNKIERTYEYDCHGWLSQVKTALPTWDVFPQASTADLSAQFYSKATEAQVEPMAFVRVPRVYTESILYAGGNSPRYDGTASAHVSTLGGRYDYSFDCHDRLVKADYSGSGDADFSAEYAYNTLAAPVKIKRQGVIDYRSIFLTGSSGEIYGTLDDLSYQWDGARLEAVTAQANGADFYGRTGFALSAQGGTADFEWNGAGLMTADSSRGITNILYNRYGQPTRVDFTDGSRVNYTYSCSGGLLKVTSYGKPTVTRPIPLAPITAQRYYCGNFVFGADTLSYVNFPGGYFDSNGSPFYRHTDWQGSVTMVTNSSGQIEQHTGYYPYGEPWAEPDGQPYLFSGKERMRDNALNEYDFSARRYIPALALWTTPDPVVHDQFNPYSYCAGNPIRFVDPSGKDHWKLNEDGTFSLLKTTDDDFDKIIGRNDASINVEKDFTEPIFQGRGQIKKEKDENALNSEPELFNASVYSAISNSKKIFEFLAENSDVEWSIATTVSGVSYIGTSNLNGTDGSIGLWKRANPEESLSVISFNHSHTNSTTDPSRGDCEAAREFMNNTNTIFTSIYNTQYRKYFMFTPVSSYEMMDGITVSPATHGSETSKRIRKINIIQTMNSIQENLKNIR